MTRSRKEEGVREREERGAWGTVGNMMLKSLYVIDCLSNGVCLSLSPLRNTSIQIEV
jgi:hypothetical protein